jgi:hypothetical protein
MLKRHLINNSHTEVPAVRHIRVIFVAALPFQPIKPHRIKTQTEGYFI